MKLSRPLLIFAPVFVLFLAGSVLGYSFISEKKNRDSQYDKEIKRMSDLKSGAEDIASKLEKDLSMSEEDRILTSAPSWMAVTEFKDRIACLLDQKGRNVPFYEGRTLCESLKTGIVLPNGERITRFR